MIVKRAQLIAEEAAARFKAEQKPRSDKKRTGFSFVPDERE